MKTAAIFLSFIASSTAFSVTSPTRRALIVSLHSLCFIVGSVSSAFSSRDGFVSNDLFDMHNSCSFFAFLLVFSRRLFIPSHLYTLAAVMATAALDHGRARPYE